MQLSPMFVLWFGVGAVAGWWLTKQFVLSRAG